MSRRLEIALALVIICVAGAVVLVVAGSASW